VNQIPETSDKRESSDFGKEIGWDFETNQPIVINGDIQIVEGVDALKIWVEKALRTERYKWPVYKWTYGSDIERNLESGLIGAALHQAIKQSITDALVYHPHISQVMNFEFKSDGDLLAIAVEVKTILDDVLEVSVNV
jgi:hypothetical protein